MDNNNATQLNTVQLTNPASLICSGSGYSNQGWYDNVIAVDPVDPNRVWTGGIDLMVSNNAGVDWGIASYWWIDPVDYGFSYSSPHADQHAIVFHPEYDGQTNTMMYVANDGGVYRANDATASPTSNSAEICPAVTSDFFWIEQFDWVNLNNSYGVTQFYHGVAYPNKQQYFAGAQDNGTLAGNDTDGANNWVEIRGGDGGYVAVDPTQTNILYSMYTRLSLQKSTNSGTGWNNAVNGINTGLDQDFLFITPFAMDEADPDTLWIGGSYLWRTTDATANWVQASTDNGSSLSAVNTAPSDSNYVLAGFSNGFIRYNHSALSADHTTAWPGTDMGNCYVSSVRFDPSDRLIAYATSSTFGCDHVWRSADGGINWSDITNNLPDIPAHDIAIDPDHTDRLFVATDLGMFVSTDNGASWAQENTGFANVIVESLDLVGTPGDYTLFAFTHGRGVWRTDLAPPPSDPVGAVSDTDIQNNEVIENQDNALVGLTAFATDPDGSTVSYSLDDTANGRFTIGASSGIVRTDLPLNAESSQSHDITVRATSTDGSFSTETFTINLLDANEFMVTTPVDNNVAPNQLNENLPMNTVVGITAFANDEDVSDNTVSYSLDDNAGGLFAIGGSSGIVLSTQALDAEVSISHTITVRASSTDGSNRLADFTISVFDVNEFPVTNLTDMNPAPNRVLESAALNSPVGVTAQANDADVDDSVTYTLQVNPENRFQIHPGNGIVSVAQQLPVASDTTFSLTIRATSTDNSFQNLSVDVVVEDIPELPVFADGFESL